MEKESKELKMGLDAQKNFAQMHEEGNVNKGIEGQMVELDPVIVQEPREKIKQGNPNPRSR